MVQIPQIQGNYLCACKYDARDVESHYNYRVINDLVMHKMCAIFGGSVFFTEPAFGSLNGGVLVLMFVLLRDKARRTCRLLLQQLMVEAVQRKFQAV
jgi:hypothetical protein